jgi:hypothetical protein
MQNGGRLENSPLYYGRSKVMNSNVGCGSTSKCYCGSVFDQQPILQTTSLRTQHNALKNTSLSTSSHATPPLPISSMNATDSEEKPASHVTVTS